MFRPLVRPTPSQKIVIVVQCLQTVSFPKDRDDRALGWLQVYQGFFSPDGLARREREGLARTPDTLFGNTSDAAVQRPDQNVIATWTPSSSYYPIAIYPVLSATFRQTTLNEQRYLQLVQAVKEILQEPSSRNPHYDPAAFPPLLPLSPADITQRVVVVATGGSNGGLAGQWLALRFPHLIDGFYAEVIPPAYQRLYGEQDLGIAIDHLSGSASLAGINETDFLIWNQFAWSQGHEVHDLSYIRHFLAGNTYRPGCFFIGDEDLTTNGAEWLRVLTGTSWLDAWDEPSPSSFGSPLHHRLTGAVAERAGHTPFVAPLTNPFAAGRTMHGRDLAHEVIQRAIAQKAAQPFVPPFPAVLPQSHQGDGVLRGLDDPHEWALGRLGSAPQSGSALQLDQAFFDQSQPGAAGTRLGLRESMKIHGGRVYVGSAEGIVSAFEVDLANPKQPLKKVAQSPQLGHGAYALAIAQGSLFVGTRRHLHRLGLAASGSSVLPVLQSQQLPWEVAQPHHLQVADVLTSNNGDELVFASKHGGLVFYSTSLAPLHEWPEPGIVDFLVQGTGSSAAVTILSARGLLATVVFDVNNHATLRAASQPLPRNLTEYVAPGSQDTWLDSPSQGAGLDLELMEVNLSAYGGGMVPGFVSAWEGDEDCSSGMAVRLFEPFTLGRVPIFVDDIENLNFPFGRGGIDLATCRESGANPIGDHLLVLVDDRLSLYSQYGVLVGRKLLRSHGDTPSLNVHSYPFGEQAHSLVVGELVTNIGGSYSQEVVIATQSGALMWMHVDDLLGTSEHLPAQGHPTTRVYQSGYWLEDRAILSPSNPPAANPVVQAHTNQSLSGTWAITMKDGDPTHLHVLDQRGGYWTVDAAGNIELQDRVWMSGSKGWSHVPVAAPPVGGLVQTYLGFVARLQQQVAFVSTSPWLPIDVFSLVFEAEPKYKFNNWSRQTGVTQPKFGDFVVHERGGATIVGSGGTTKEVWFWSAPGYVVEGYRVQQPNGVIDGIWASTRWPASITGSGSTEVGDRVQYHDLRHTEETSHAAEQQSLAAVKLLSGQTVVVLGCPGGRVRVLQPGTWREDATPSVHHTLGSVQSGAVDHGYGGCALAVRHEVNGSNEQVRIFFGTLYGPLKRPSQYASTATNAQLQDDEVACGGIHEYVWTPQQGLAGPVFSMQLQPTSANPRGGYGVVGLKVVDILPSPGEELIACTLAGDIFVYSIAAGSGALSELWRANVPGAVGFHNSIVVADLDGDMANELYVAGSFGLWRFH